jgi:hypothetical protein
MKLEISPLSVWEKLKNSTEPIIMYGTGNGADKVLDILGEKGIKIHGVTASNTFVRERTFRGFRVMPISFFEEMYDDFTIIVTFGTSIPDVMDNIYSLSERHKVLVPVVPVIGTTVFDEAFLSENRETIEKAYSLACCVICADALLDAVKKSRFLLYLFRLDPVSEVLELTVFSSEEIVIAVLVDSPYVSGPVNSLTIMSLERIVHEA